MACGKMGSAEGPQSRSGRQTRQSGSPQLWASWRRAGRWCTIDDLADAQQLEAALNSSGSRLILTTADHLDANGAILRAQDVAEIRIGEDGRSEPGATVWQALANKQAEALPVPANDEPAMLSWTSGTTGSPKGHSY